MSRRLPIAAYLLRSSDTLLPAVRRKMREALIGAFQQLCGDSEVDGRRGWADMAEECGKIQQPRNRIDTCTVPTQKRSHCKRMAKAMKVRLRDTIWNHEVKGREQVVKGLADRVRRYGSSLLPGKGEYRAVW